MNNTKLDDAEARAALERAVELEAEEEAYAEEQEAAARALAAAREGEQRLSAADMEVIGAQAGIDTGHVRAAIAAYRGGFGAARVSPALAWLAGAEPRALVRTAVLEAPAAEVSASIAAVATRPPFGLVAVWAEPYEHGGEDVILEVLGVEASSRLGLRLLGGGSRRVHVSVRPLSAETTEVVVRGDYGAAARGAPWTALIFALLAAPLAGMIVAKHHPLGAAAGVAAITAFVAVLVARACNGWSLRRAGDALGALLDMVRVDLRTGGRFRATLPDRRRVGTR